MKQFASLFLNRLRLGSSRTPKSSLQKHSPTQAMFIQWNASRLGISVEESQKRYEKSWSTVSGGHGGPAYRSYNDLSYELFQVFFADDPSSIFESYEFFAPMHFLRMLSYEDPAFDANSEIVRHFNNHRSVTILDFGCGLANQSRSLAACFAKSGRDVHLVLADIPTLRKGFLTWVATQIRMKTTFLDCTRTAPLPALPPCDICFATEFFEHVHEPIPYLKAFHDALTPRGLLVTDISDHHAEFMHVSPRLHALRQRVKELGLVEVVENRVFCKTE